MIAIYKREIRALFQSVIGWLFCSVVLFFISLYFAAGNLLYGSPYIANALQSAGLICLISIPILTMRILSEERKQKTDQLILTAPVSVWEIVVGKYLALLSILLVPVAIVCTYPLILGRFGSVGYAEAYTAILGFTLYAATGIAIGVFISSITESQVIAAVLTFLILFLTYIMSGLCGIISSGGNLLTNILSQFDLYKRFTAFMAGTLDVKALIYFISVIFLFLFLTCQSIQKRRFCMSVRKLKRGVFSTGMIAVGMGLVVVINLIANELPVSVASIDVTSEKLYEISDTTEKTVKNLKDDITIYVLTSKNSQDSTLEKTLDKYKSMSSHIKVEYKDPMKSPTFYNTYTTEAPSQNSLIVVSDKRNRVIDYSSIYQTETDYNTGESKTTGYDGEGQITSAIDFVTSDSLEKMYIVQGHDELELEASFTDAISKANIETETINLMQSDSVPEDAGCVLLLAPISDFSADDAKKITDYLNNGGKAMIVSTYAEKDMTNFQSILTPYGVTIQNGLVVETDNNMYYQSPFYLLPEIQADTATAGLYGEKKLVFAPFAQGMTYQEPAADSGLVITPLLSTSSESFVKKDVSNNEDYTRSEGDVSGPFYLGLKIEKTTDAGTAEIALFSSEGLFTEQTDTMVSGSNLQLFSNTISGMMKSDAVSVVPVKNMSVEFLTVSQGTFIAISLVIVILLPIISLIAGILIWVRRRRR